MQINCEKIKKYVQQHILKTTITYFKPINRGGMSLNFICKTNSKKYIIKAINKEKKERIIKLCNILEALKKEPLIYTAHLETFNNQTFFEYEDKLIIIISYVKGKKISYLELSPLVIDSIYNSYKYIAKLDIEVLPQKVLMNIYSENKQILGELLKQNKNFIKTKILNAIYKLNESLKTDISLEKPLKIIHGDASLNNCLVDDENNVALLDFELMRYGYEIEDWAEFLISSLSQHSILFIPKNRLSQLIGYTNTLFNFTKQEWIYGINLYFLNLLNKRIKSKKLFKSIRKAALFTLNINKKRSIYSVLDKIY